MVVERGVVAEDGGIRRVIKDADRRTVEICSK